MRRYIPRLAWYFSLFLIIIGLLGLPINQFVISSLLKAVGKYLPISIIWVFISYFWIKSKIFPMRTSGLGTTETIGWMVICIGVIICIGCYLINKNSMLYIGMAIVFSGFDWILSVREQKSIIESMKCQKNEDTGI